MSFAPFFDTSGLKPLKLPASLTDLEHPADDIQARPAPSPEAVARFQTAMGESSAQQSRTPSPFQKPIIISHTQETVPTAAPSQKPHSLMPSGPGAAPITDALSNFSSSVISVPHVATEPSSSQGVPVQAAHVPMPADTSGRSVPTAPAQTSPAMPAPQATVPVADAPAQEPVPLAAAASVQPASIPPAEQPVGQDAVPVQAARTPIHADAPAQPSPAMPTPQVPVAAATAQEPVPLTIAAPVQPASIPADAPARPAMAVTSPSPASPASTVLPATDTMAQPAGQITGDKQPIVDSQIPKISPTVKKTDADDYVGDVQVTGSPQLQAAPVSVPFAPTDAAPIAGIAPVAIEIDPAAATARTHELVEAASQVADTILVTPSLIHGEGEITIQLKPTILDGSEIRLEAKGSSITVAITPATPSAAQAIASAKVQFEQTLAERIPSFQIAVSVENLNLKTSRRKGAAV